MFDLKEFVEILKMSDVKLFSYLEDYLEKQLYNKKPETTGTIPSNDFIYCKGEFPVLLVAHLDVVHKQVPTVLYKEITNHKNSFKLYSPTGIGGDDRCGVWIILNILHYFDLSGKPLPSVLFTMGEEVGGLGAQTFCEEVKELKDIKYILEYDRKGYTDVVSYDDGNDELTKLICKYGAELGIDYKEANGTFSDISYICPHFGISGVNLSSGYYNAHTEREYIEYGEVKKITQVGYELMLKLDEEVKDPIKYEEVNYAGVSYSNWWNDYYKDYYENPYYSKKGNSKNSSKVNSSVNSSYNYNNTYTLNAPKSTVKPMSELTEHDYIMTWADEYYNGNYKYMDNVVRVDVKYTQFNAKKQSIRNFFAYSPDDDEKIKQFEKYIRKNNKGLRNLKENERRCDCCGKIVSTGEYLNIINGDKNYIKCNTCITDTLKAKYKLLDKSK